jgi:hypothetical protein
MSMGIIYSSDVVEVNQNLCSSAEQPCGLEVDQAILSFATARLQHDPRRPPHSCLLSIISALWSNHLALLEFQHYFSFLFLE